MAEAPGSEDADKLESGSSSGASSGANNSTAAGATGDFLSARSSESACSSRLFLSPDDSNPGSSNSSNVGGGPGNSNDNLTGPNSIVGTPDDTITQSQIHPSSGAVGPGTSNLNTVNSLNLNLGSTSFLSTPMGPPSGPPVNKVN